MNKPLYTCMTKATTAEGENLRCSLNWIVARRAMLKVMPDALVCGDWHIPYNKIDEAVLFSIWSIFPGFLLRVRVAGTIYQFGFNWNSYWKKKLPFTVTREKGELKLSAFSISIRVFVLAYVAYMLWENFKG